SAPGRRRPRSERDRRGAPGRPAAHSVARECRDREHRGLIRRSASASARGRHAGTVVAGTRGTPLMLGLVLTAGGAPGAYPAGVLKRIGEIPGLREAPSPFAIVTGASAGAINGAAVAAGSASLHDATR